MTDSTPLPEAATASAPLPAPSAAREVLTVFRHEFRALFLSGRTLLPMLVYAGFGAIAMYLFLKAETAAAERAAALGVGPKEIEESLATTLGAVMKFVGWGDEGVAAEIIRDHVPLLILFFFALASFFLPLLVAVVTFDQFSDLSTRGSRFALLRVRRWAYVAGKSLAAFASVAGFLLAMWVVVVGITLSRGAPAQAFDAVVEGLRAWALMCVLALPYLAITALVSAFMRPGQAFVATFGVYIAMWIASHLVHRIPAVGDALQLAFPAEHAPKLVARYPPTLAAGVFALVAIAGVLYVGLGYLVGERDV